MLCFAVEGLAALISENEIAGVDGIPVCLCRGLGPLDLFCVRFASRHCQHRRSWINTRHPVTAFGEGTAERACPATQVEDTTFARSGEGAIEVGILRPGLVKS